ncbi:SCP2 sterol-binding domain-containing protein [Nocardioides panaciterrulae]|uniref:Putative sterol carrier protein n=1 Tax=Nocardioides panaciterrulae TaxID=661492 RepID=A0A7Y9E5W6_9ACTN|nr:SCP2 sterol-binding domain-containing protein [Nocardioides panaciterrulae]NYD41670.1 putative sterol carrier protein [Nocardioides panaciterrulae]
MTTGLEHLRTASHTEATAFFADIDPEALVAEVRRTGDEELLALIAREEVRPAAVEGILARLHEYAVAERLADLRGVVRFDLERRGTLLERHGLVFEAGTMVLRRGLSATEPTDVVLRTSVLRFVRIVSGQLNAGLEYLRGKLDIDGDALLALAVGGIFRVPGTGEIAVDPTTLDPVEVATVLGEVRGEHLKKVMASGFRPIVLGEIFRRLPDFVDERRAAKADLTIGFRLLGNPTGEVERYVVRVRGGVATVSAGDAGEERDATVTCEGHDYLRLATGHLNPVTGVLKGQLKVRGDKAKALALSSVIDIPKPAR